MTAYINSIKSSCNSEEGFPEGALGMTALAVSHHSSPRFDTVYNLSVGTLRLSALSLHTIAATRPCPASSRKRTASLLWLTILMEQLLSLEPIAGTDLWNPGVNQSLKFQL